MDYLGLRPFLAVGGLGPNGWASSSMPEAGKWWDNEKKRLPPVRL